MPCNEASGVSCTIVLASETDVPAGPCFEEYQHHAARSSVTDAIQEIVFVESTAGTPFEIELEITAEAYSKLHRCGGGQHRQLSADDYLVDVHLDGVTVSRYFIQLTGQPSRFRFFSSISPNRRTIRTFQFGQLALVDDNNETLDPEAAHQLAAELCDDEHVISNLGSIRVDIIRCQFGAPRAWSPEPSSSLLCTSNQMKFSERAKKACVSNTAGLSQSSFPSPFGKEKDMIKTPVKWEDPHPFLQFVFNYRSRALLEAQGIVQPPITRPSEHIKLARDRSGINSLLRTSLGQPSEETKPKPKYIKIDSDSDGEEDIKPKPGSRTQSKSELADTKEDVKIPIKTNNSRVAVTAKTKKKNIKRVFVGGDKDQNKEARKKKKSKVIDLTQD